MQKLINAIALFSGLVSLTTVVGAVYLYKNADVIIQNAQEKAIEEITKSLPKIVEGMMPNIPELPKTTGGVIPSTSTLTGPAIPFGQ